MSADSSLQLIGDKKRNKVNLDRCIICQKYKRSENLTSTENGGSNIRAASTILQDDLLSDLDENDINAVKYHLKSCYKSYILLSKRSASIQHDDSGVKGDEDNENGHESKTRRRVKRRKVKDDKKPFVICNQIKFKGDENLYRLCEENRAQLFLSTIQLNLDEVYTRCATYKTIGDIFAADIYSHKNCTKRSRLQYQRNADELMQEDDLGADSKYELHEAFNKMTGELNLATSGYLISACRDIINEDLEGYTVNNRKVNQMLIAHFGEEICFTYPRDKSKP